MTKIQLLFLLIMISLVSCSSPESHDHEHEAHARAEREAVQLDGRKLNVVATTSIIGDVLANVAGDDIELAVIIGRNQDTHSYEATPSDLVALEQADFIFVNGFGLEEQLAETVRKNFADKFASISTEVEPLAAGEDAHDDHDDGHDHGTADPHVWFAVPNVINWATFAGEVLSELDPANAEGYEERAEAYSAELTTLHDEISDMIDSIPSANRKLVTNHDALAYFADTYNFDVVGTVIPSTSTNAEPSPKELAALIQTMEAENVCAIFAETSQSVDLAEVVSAELDHCDQVQVLALHTGSLGDGEASTYLGMFRQNVEVILSVVDK